MSDDFDAAAIVAIPLVERAEVHAELGSTNDRAKELARDPAVAAERLPRLIVADRQTAGRGRGGKQWHASDGALTFSLLIDPAAHGLSLDRQGLLAIATAVAVIEAIRTTTGLSAGLKWPNDVLLGGPDGVAKKVAGILIEAPRSDRWVVGVGINVNNSFEEATAEVAARATSLRQATGNKTVRQAVLEAFLGDFTTRLANPSAVIEAARKACVLTGHRVTLADGDRTTIGTCRGIADDGALLIRTREEVLECRAGTVTLQPRTT